MEIEFFVFVARFNKKQELINNCFVKRLHIVKLKQHLRVLVDLGSNTSKTYSSHGYNQTNNISILPKL